MFYLMTIFQLNINFNIDLEKSKEFEIFLLTCDLIF